MKLRARVAVAAFTGLFIGVATYLASGMATPAHFLYGLLVGFGVSLVNQYMIIEYQWDTGA
jgi:hypothetical protein